MSAPPLLSLIVATKGRASPLEALFASLRAQTFTDFEVVVVDQNPDDRVGAPERDGWPFPIVRLHTPGEAGLSRARNSGLSRASGRVVLFPDDDCWYPPTMLAHAMERMDALGAEVLAGRASDEAGRDINGRFERHSTRIERGNVFTTGIEWVVFFKRAALDALGGYNTEIGVGAATPWQACEGQDIMLRALAAGFSCWYDPSVFGHHAELDVASPSMAGKGKAYARGLGYVLRLHAYPFSTAVNWMLRPAVRAGLSLLRGDRARYAYYRNVAIGRYEGWRMKVAATAPMSVNERSLGLSQH